MRGQHRTHRHSRATADLTADHQTSAQRDADGSNVVEAVMVKYRGDRLLPLGDHRESEVLQRTTLTTRGDLLAITRGVIAYVSSPTGGAVLRAATLTVDDAYAQARQDFWACRVDALSPVVARGIERGDLRANSDPRLLLEMLIAPLHARLLITGEHIDDNLAERLVDVVLNGAAAPPNEARHSARR